jgi:hypothetical protein
MKRFNKVNSKTDSLESELLSSKRQGTLYKITLKNNYRLNIIFYYFIFFN